jgi:hypothetical protein
MLDSGGGGGYGGTNWAAMSMIDMWMTLQNQDTTPHWQLVDGWRKSYELTLQHMSAVRSYRENLSTAWPPERSPAAAAYIGRLDELLGHLQETYDAAIANHSALSSATLSISSSRTDLEQVVTEYLANEAKLVDYEQAREVAAMPVGGKGSVPRPTPKNPVPNGRQAELEAKARSIMSSLSVDLTQAKSQLKEPKPYQPLARGDVSEDSSDIVGPPPSVPPVTAFDPGSGGAGTSRFSQIDAPTAPQSTSGGGRLPGLVLGGNQPPVIAPPAPPPVSPPLGGGPSGGPTFGTPLPPVLGGAGGPGAIRSGTARPSTPPMSGGRVTPPGGVIGAVPGTSAGQSSIGRPPVNPVGGVIAPNTVGRPGNAANRPVAQPIGMTGSRPLDSDEEIGENRRWDPDNPWQTAKGVDPVLKPQEELPIDPGPAIGLS